MALQIQPFHCATDRTLPGAWAFSADGAKLVHLIRHGQGAHNVAAALRGAEAYKDQTLRDASLDDVGVQQATQLGQWIRDARMVVDVVLVSPLTRTLQTASYMFPEPRPAGLHFVAIEMCREAHGGHPCDQRRPIRELAKEFPHVDFSLVESDDDTWHDPKRRETVREVAIRGDKFLDIIRARPERNIAVVSHGVFLETFLSRASLACVDDTIRGRRFDNAEMRSVVIGGWTPAPSSSSGAGGAAAQAVAARDKAGQTQSGAGGGRPGQPTTTTSTVALGKAPSGCAALRQCLRRVFEDFLFPASP